MNDPWRRGLEVMQTMLSGQSGRLFMELRDKRSMAYSVSAMLMEGIDPGSFSVYMGTSPEKVEAALAGIRAELARLREDLVSEAELARAQGTPHRHAGHRAAAQRRPRGRDGPRRLLRAGGRCLPQYPEEIAAVTAEDIRASAQRVIDFQREALAVVGP